jgi:hypothetical protein
MKLFRENGDRFLGVRNGWLSDISIENGVVSEKSHHLDMTDPGLCFVMNSESCRKIAQKTVDRCHEPVDIPVVKAIAMQIILSGVSK